MAIFSDARMVASWFAASKYFGATWLLEAQ
jgi:hypothetical protein